MAWNEHPPFRFTARPTMNPEPVPAAASADALGVVPSAPAALADHLAARRQHILAAWQKAVAADPALTTSEGLTRTQFLDHIPQVLRAFEHSLREDGQADASLSPGAHPLGGSVEHGQHRWQQGYDLREVILEWGHLLRCLSEELGGLRGAHPPVDPAALPAAQRALASLVNAAIADSAEQYSRLQQKEVIQVRHDLESELAALTESNRRRAANLRESSHDVRGQLNVITSAASLLDADDLEADLRAEAFDILTKGTHTLKEMVLALLEEARVNPGQEQPRLGPFDAAALLGRLCAASQPLARERHLFLRTDGPRELPVEGDRAKVQRIAQNLVLNALRYTVQGGVTVSWREDSPAWWSFEVRDTGPGLPPAALGRAAADPSAVADDDAGDTAPEDGPFGNPHGEGIGLLIVHRLCEVLGANLKTVTGTGEGTTFTVTLPRRYAA